MEKITIKEIQRINKHSAAKNKDYVSVIITDTTGRKMSGFGNKVNEKWVAGQEVNVEIQQKGKYLNFTLPERRIDPSSLLEEVSKKFAEVDERIKNLENKVYGIRTITEKDEQDYEAQRIKEEENNADYPF
jgi:replicative DNA helicase